jgi:hypothetical protein
MSPAHHLAVARTPLQLFNCIEARDRFHADDVNTLVLVYRKRTDRLLMEGMLDERWTSIVHFELTTLRRNLYPLFLRKLPAVVDTCTIGLPKHLNAHLINTLKPNNVRIIDDGNEMLILAEQLESLIERPPPRSVSGKEESTRFLAKATFFTIHNLEAWVPQERLVRNDYRVFRAAHSMLPKTDEIAFIGSPVYERDLIEKEAFVRALESIGQHFPGRGITYYPHRYEDLPRLTNDVKKLAMTLAQPESILEYAFAKRGHLPQEIISFRSSAVETLRDLYGLQATILAWDLDSIRPDRREMYRTLYKSFHQQQLNVVPLTLLTS